MESPFYIKGGEEERVFSVLGQHLSYPNAGEFFQALTEAAQYFGTNWHRNGNAFTNYMSDVCPTFRRELALLRMYFCVRKPTEVPDTGTDLYKMRRYGRCTLPDAVYLVSMLARLRGAQPISFDMVQRTDAERVPPLRGTVVVKTAAAQFRKFDGADTGTTPQELLYGFKSMSRMEPGNDSKQEIRQNMGYLLTSRFCIAPEDAEMFADIFLSAQETPVVSLYKDRQSDKAASYEKASPVSFTTIQRTFTSPFTPASSAPDTPTVDNVV